MSISPVGSNYPGDSVSAQIDKLRKKIEELIQKIQSGDPSAMSELGDLLAAQGLKTGKVDHQAAAKYLEELQQLLQNNPSLPKGEADKIQRTLDIIGGADPSLKLTVNQLTDDLRNTQGG